MKDDKIFKKSFNISVDLNKRFDEMHPSNKDHSVSGAAAILLWVALEDYPGLREQLRRMGQGPINAATVKKAKELLAGEVMDQAIHTQVDQRITDKRADFLLEMMKDRKKSPV